VRWLVLAAVVLGAQAFADEGFSRGVEGWGRISVYGGYRWTPNWYFTAQAAAAGFPVTQPSKGGPLGMVSFGYGAFTNFELAVDVFAAFETFTLDQYAPFSATTYGALIGPRLTKKDLFPGFTPYAGVEGGPTLALVQSASVTNPERLLGGLAVVGGFHLMVADRWAISFDVRWIYARAVVPGISGINVGGVLFSLGVSTFFSPAPRREYEVPGFDTPSRL
jgi:hypothetical protein